MHLRKSNRVLLRADVATLVQPLSYKQRELIRPVLEHPREYVLLSIRGLAHKIKSDPATTFRVVQSMGFRGYREFQRYLHELSVATATPLDLMEKAGGKDSSLFAHVRESLERDARNLHAIAKGTDLRRVAALAKRLYSARWIVVLGGDLAGSLVAFIEYHLTILGLPVFAAMGAGKTAHLVRNVKAGDVVFAMSFRRGLRQTVEGCQRARANGAYCVGITDTLISPLNRFANETFLASVEMSSFGASYVAPMALLNCILVACANYRRTRTLALLRQAEEEQRHGFRWYPEFGASRDSELEHSKLTGGGGKFDAV